MERFLAAFFFQRFLSPFMVPSGCCQCVCMCLCFSLSLENSNTIDLCLLIPGNSSSSSSYVSQRQQLLAITYLVQGKAAIDSDILTLSGSLVLRRDVCLSSRQTPPPQRSCCVGKLEPNPQEQIYKYNLIKRTGGTDRSKRVELYRKQSKCCR